MSDATTDVPLPGMPEPDPNLVGDVTGRRRTYRERVELFLGYNLHPVSKVPLHPEAPRDATRKDRFPRDFTCGTCVFRQKLYWNGREYPKCTKGLPYPEIGWSSPRATHSPITDAWAWFPGCRDYEKDPDAAERNRPRSKRFRRRRPPTTGPGG